MKKRMTSAVHSAIVNNDVAAFDQVIGEVADIEQVDRDGRTLLANAIAADAISIAERLIRAGANVNTRDQREATPLHIAAQRYNADAVKLLLKAGALVDAKDGYGNTPLFKAVFESRGRPEVIAVLLKAGADQTVRNSSGVSPKDLADSIANFDVASLLRSG